MMRKYFTGKNVDLIPFEEEHIEEVRGWNNREDISFYMGGRFPSGKKEQKIWYNNLLKDNTKKKLIIVDKTVKMVGMVSLFNIDNKNQKLEIGVYISPEDQKKGYAGESLKMIIDFSFKELNIHKIYALIQEDNSPSIELFKSVGFEYESTDFESLFSRGKFIDIHKYTIFKKDASL